MLTVYPISPPSFSLSLFLTPLDLARFFLRPSRSISLAHSVTVLLLPISRRCTVACTSRVRAAVYIRKAYANDRALVLITRGRSSYVSYRRPRAPKYGSYALPKFRLRTAPRSGATTGVNLLLARQLERSVKRFNLTWTPMLPDLGRRERARKPSRLAKNSRRWSRPQRFTWQQHRALSGVYNDNLRHKNLNIQKNLNSKP